VSSLSDESELPGGASESVPAVGAATLTIAEASRATGISRESLRRDIGSGRFPGAFREATARGPDTGRWRIPVSDVVAAGFSLGLAALEQPEERYAAERYGPANIEIERLRAALADERSRRIAAETLAEERGQAILEARNALRSEGDDDSPVEELPTWKRPGRRGNWLR
jgi:hypothetical protein